MTIGRFRIIAQNLLLPLIGFLGGWTAYRVVEENGFINEVYLKQLHKYNLRMQLYLQRNVFPTAFTKAYGHTEEFLTTMIDRLNESGNNNTERWTFEEVLQECPVSEQIVWLEEHVSQDIPYFYIADIFNSWSNLHRSFFTAETHAAKKTPSVTLRDCDDKKNAFTSEVLCKGVVEKTLSGVFPYDVGVRALCVLAAGSSSNAQLLSRLISSNVILQRYEAYVEGLRQRDVMDGDAIPASEVAAATLELLRLLDVVVGREWRFLFWRRAAAQVDEGQWCRCFGKLSTEVEEACTERAVCFASTLSLHFDCKNKKQLSSGFSAH